jgi:ABC-type cobalamin/Fe3+-siderophores transport system ATPase subunit
MRWQAEVPDAAKQADIARAEFVTALTQLYEAPEATPLIREQLQLGQQQWVFFANALAQQDPRQATAQHALDVFKTSETLLQVMDRVTGLYARTGAA